MDQTTKGRVSLLGRSAALSCLKPEQLEELALLGDYAVYEAEQVVFDRNQNRFHGRIKALADGARAGGLKF